MSNIYIQEPPTSGKVLLKTTVGDIDVELWTREAPKACKNFIQLCMEGYYNGTIFHRVIKGFIVQGGDPNGDGTGGDSIYGAPFKDEFHTRLRFSRRGLLAMANAGKDDNGSQFFFTMGATAELQNKHTIFGKVTGETIYNMLKLEEGLIDHDERPQYPNKILKTEVLINPFKDIVPRIVEKKDSSKEKSLKKEKKAGVKNFKLLSFGEEAEEDEELASVANEKFAGKSKSTHDILDDPKLSSLPAVETEDDNKRDASEADLHQEELENIRKKLKGGDGKKRIAKTSTSKVVEQEPDEEDEEEYYLGKDRQDEKKKKMENIRKEIRDLKKDFQENKKKVHEETEKKTIETTNRSDTLKEYDDTIVKYAEKQKTLPKKGTSREQFTLQLLKKFQQKLDAAKEKVGDSEDAQKPVVDDDEDADDDTWLAHKLSFADNMPILARDANTKDDTWYDLNDPRNPINKRRREESKKSLHKKGGTSSGGSGGAHGHHRR